MKLFQEMTFQTFLVAIFSSLGGVSFGIDFGYWSGVLGMAQFAEDFGVHDKTTNTFIIPSSWKSAGSGLPTAGLAVGSTISGLVGQRLGRIRCLQISYLVALVGIVLQAASISSYWQLTVGRIVTSVALGILANTIPAYLAEVSPLSIRGTLVNGYQFSIGVGAVLVATCNWGMYQRTDHWAYRTPIILQGVLPCAFVVASFFIPESPRWLLGVGRVDEAKRELQRLRPNVTEAVLDQEIELIAAAEEENRGHFQGSWEACFKQSNFRRTLIVIGVQCLQQAQGSAFMGQYSVVFFQAIGFKDVYLVSVLIGCCMAVASAFAFYLPDRFGRRWIMIVCALVMCACMCTVSGITGSGSTLSTTTLNGAMAALFTWQIMTSIGWSSCAWIITAEVPTLRLREKSITLATVSGFCVSVLVSFVSPFIQDKGFGGLESRIGYLYGAISLAAAAWAFFFLPETGFRSLEELDELFQKSVPVWKFRKYQTSGYGAQLHVIEAEDCDSKQADLERKSIDKVEKE